MSEAAGRAVSAEATIDLNDPVIAAHVADLPVTTITGPDGVPVQLVPLLTYLAVEDARDDFMRACALVNGWRTNPARTDAELDRILARVNMGWSEGRAVADIVAQVRAGTFMKPTTAPATEA